MSRVRNYACINTYMCRYIDALHIYPESETNGATQIEQARTANHGDALDARRLLGARITRGVSGEEQARIHYGSNDGLSAGDKKGSALHEEDRQGQHL